MEPWQITAQPTRRHEGVSKSPQMIWQAQHTYVLLYGDVEVERGHDGMDDEHKACQIIEKLRLSVYNNITRSVMQALNLGDADVYFANETEMNVLPPFTAWEGP